ncbi:GNAT family N-acetyltransferase [Rudaea sp.]|uniref:GNAT family N-acetyltransferase n=2 Tax=Rudaea sp. TaxID=2136325 RepID=UPI002ED07A16
MNDNAPETEVYVRLAHADDDEFILSLARRFAEFELPPWRKRTETLAGIERDIEHHLRVLPPASHLFVAEDEDATPLGFLHLQTRKDFFTGALNCHISDLVVAAEHEGRGVAAAMLRFADEWAKEHRCRFLTLGVFPNNERARRLYEHHGFGVEILSMVKPVR